MPITTQTIAKRIPPTLYEPRPSHKVKKGKNHTRVTTKSSHKRAAPSDSDNEKEEPIKRKGAKSVISRYKRSRLRKGRLYPRSEPPEEIDGVDNGVATSPSSDEQEVST